MQFILEKQKHIPKKLYIFNIEYVYVDAINGRNLISKLNIGFIIKTNFSIKF